MTRRGVIVLCATFILLAGAAAALDRALDGVPDFYVWKLFSGRAHGGARANIDGVSLYFETYGAGPPVLVLTGGGSILEMMHFQITHLARDHFVIAPDSRAQGRSNDAPGELHYQTMTDDMIALMNRLHIARADVVGWSDGGIIALDLARRYPSRVRRIVAMGANFNPDGLAFIPAAPPPGRPAIDENGLAYRLTSSTPDHWPVVYGKILRMWAGEPQWTPADLGRIRAPALIIAGERDVIRRHHTDALARAIPGAQEVIIPGATHRAAREAHDRVNAAIDAFFAAHPEP